MVGAVVIVAVLNRYLPFWHLHPGHIGGLDPWDSLYFWIGMRPVPLPVAWKLERFSRLKRCLAQMEPPCNSCEVETSQSKTRLHLGSPQVARPCRM